MFEPVELMIEAQGGMEQSVITEGAQSRYTHEALRKWGAALDDEKPHLLGEQLMRYAEAWRRQLGMIPGSKMTQEYASLTFTGDQLKALLLFAGKNDHSRSYLNGVHVECANDVCHLVANDGARMLIMQLEAKGVPACTAILPRIPLELILQHTKAEEYTFRQTSRLCWQCGDDTLVSLDIPYPDWRSADITKVSGEAGHYDFAYLGDIGKAGKLLGCRPILRQNGPLRAARIEFTSNCHGLLMPTIISTATDVLHHD